MTRLQEEAVRAVLQHPGRSQVLQACIGRARSAKAISEQVDVPMVTCYRHLHELEEAGLVRVERSAMTKTGRPYDLYQSTVDRAGLRLDSKGLHADWSLRTDMRDRLHGLWRQLEDRR